MPQEQPAHSLEEYWCLAMRRRWWLLLPIFFSWTMVIVAGRFIPPRYRSETVILVEQQRVPEQYVLPNIGLDVQERLRSMSQQILSRTRLQAIIEKFRLYRGTAATFDAEGAVQRMRGDIKIDPVAGRPGELSAFKISYSAPTPWLAQQVTKELSSVFIEENLHHREQLSEDTTKFLQLQVAQARATLDEQDRRLNDFKANYLGELPEQLQSNLQIFAGLQARFQAATDALDRANQQKVYLESLRGGYRTLRAQVVTPRNAASASPATLEEQLNKLRTELADLSGRYTPNHPDIIRLKQQIATAQKLKQQAEADILANPAADTLDPKESANSLAELQAVTPILQMDGQLKANQLEIELRKQEIIKLQSQIQQYQMRLNTIPVREQQLAAITRDHDQARTNYESLLAKQQSSAMATNLEKQQQAEPFRIIDPPNLPQRPYWPNRLKLSLAGLALGAFFGLGLTVLVETIDARIYREQDLKGMLPVPILIGIPPLKTAREQQKLHRFRCAEAIAAAALFIFIPLMTLFNYPKW